MERIVYHDGMLPPSRGTECTSEECRTRQSEADQADINKIVARFERTGVMPIDEREALFMDVSEVGDFRSAREQVRRVEEYFMTLDASVRSKFENDPAVFLDRFNGGEDRELFEEIGVLEKEKVPEVVPPVPPPA